jgi:hypothetical protein
MLGKKRMSVLPVETNPYIVQHLEYTQQEKEIKLASHLLEVECVYQESRPLAEEVIDSVRIFCAEHRIEFGLRPFNSDAFIQDREHITKLPAFHIYYKDEYEKSFYPGSNPAVEIQLLLKEIRDYTSPRKKKWFTFKLPSFSWKWKRKTRIVASSN